MAGRPARYFPVRETPYRMEAALHRFGRDFGNGDADRCFFQRDDELARYREAKAAVPAHRRGLLAGGEDERGAHGAVERWMRERLAHELPDLAIPRNGSGDPAAFYGAVAAAVQEDFVVIRRRPESASAIAVFVALPSHWRPERIPGASFVAIHGPVPGFADDPAQARAMVATMVERGPYVRFVWTITADGHLDHHPDEGRREPWDETSRGWLRVERQVTVPFPAEDASLFLIRVYLYPFDALGRDERATLARALRAMPEPIARYKGLDARIREIATARLADA